jgi:hypothetical protein
LLAAVRAENKQRQAVRLQLRDRKRETARRMK